MVSKRITRHPPGIWQIFPFLNLPQYSDITFDFMKDYCFVSQKNETLVIAIYYPR